MHFNQKYCLLNSAINFTQKDYLLMESIQLTKFLVIVTFIVLILPVAGMFEIVHQTFLKPVGCLIVARAIEVVMLG